MARVLKVFSSHLEAIRIDKSRSFDVFNMIPCDHDSPALIPKQKALFDDKDVVFLITRSKNDNTVVYRSKCENGQLIAEDPIEVYWMGFSRKDPHIEDPVKLRDDLSWIEKKMAYGVSAHKRGHSTEEFDIKLVAVAHLKSVLKIVGGRPRMVGQVGGRECFILRVYVSAKENMIGLPTVLWVNIHGIDVETGEEIVEKISP